MHEVNTTSVWKMPGSIHGDFAKGTESVNNAIKALTRRMDSMEDHNQKQHKATHLQLSTITKDLQNVTQAISNLDGHLVSSQCVILAQSAELGLTHNLSDLCANKMTLKMQLLVGMEPGKIDEVKLMLAELEKEETSLQNQISQASRSFLTIIGGHVDQLQPDTLSNPAPLDLPTAPPGLSKTVHMDSQSIWPSMPLHSNKSDDQHSFSTKRRRLSNDDIKENEVATYATGGTMVVDVPDPQAKKVHEVCPLPSPQQDTLMVIHNDTSVSPLNCMKKPLPRSTGIFRGVFNCWRDLSSGHRESHPPCRYTRTYRWSSEVNVLLFLGMLIFMVSMVGTVSAYVPPAATSSFTLFSINANGMVQPVKVNHFNSVIGARRPHIFVINETKTKSKLGGSLLFSNYDIYEEPGECAEGHHIFKWGVVVGIHKDIQVAQRLELTQRALKG